jgi:hypothetical protein
MLSEGSARFTTAIKNKKFDDIGIGEVLVRDANAKLAILKTELIENKKSDDIGIDEVFVRYANAKLAILKTHGQLTENSENLNRLRKEQKK